MNSPRAECPFPQSGEGNPPGLLVGLDTAALEALHREMEQRMDESGARIVRTRQLLAGSAALLQRSKIPRPRVTHPEE
jgi:hypothetical protein